MGKRKSRTSKSMSAPRKLPKLDTLFTCPFCNYPEAVGSHIDRKDWIRAACRICSESYFTSAHTLTEAVDVYGEWIDACDLANRASAAAGRASSKSEAPETTCDLNLT